MTDYKVEKDQTRSRSSNDNNVVQPCQWTADFPLMNDIHLPSSTGNPKFGCFYSVFPFKARKKQRKKEDTFRMIALVFTWLRNAFVFARKNKPKNFRDFSMERITFVPYNTCQTRKPYIDTLTPWESDYGLVVPAACQCVVVQHTSKGGGVFYVKSSRSMTNQHQELDVGVKLHRNYRVEGKNFRFRRVVFLPLWIEKCHPKAMNAVFDHRDMEFLDAIFFMDVSDAIFVSFSNK